jgi:hypothetical protein
MMSSLFEDLLDPVFLADVMVAEELDGQSRVRRQFLGMAAELIAERFGELGVIEDADVVIEEIASGGLGVADVWERPGDDDSIQARQDTRDLLGMSFDEVEHGRPGG